MAPLRAALPQAVAERLRPELAAVVSEVVAAIADEVPSLFPANEARGFLDRWGEVQSRFVDDPKRAVHDGDALVAEVMQTLAASFARHKADLEGQWNTGDAATDDLRQAFQRYRAFFQRLLSA